MHHYLASQLSPVPQPSDFPQLMITLDDSPLDFSPAASPTSGSEFSPDDISLFGAPLRPGRAHKHGTQSVDLSRRNAISRASGYGQWRHSSAVMRRLSLASSDLHSAPTTDFEGIVRAPPATAPAAPPSPAPSPPVSPRSQMSLLSSPHTLRARWRAPPRPKRRGPDRQLTFLTELSDSDCEGDDEDTEHAELFAQAADLLRVRLAATVEAQRVARADMRRSGAVLGLDSLADNDEIDD